MKSENQTTNFVLPVHLHTWFKSFAARQRKSMKVVLVELLEKLREKDEK